MPRTAILFGVLLLALGLGDYYWSTNRDWRILIAAVMGAAILVLGLAAFVKRSWHRGAMHAAVIVGLVGFVATVNSLYDLVKRVFENGAQLAESTMAVLCGVFVLLSVKSFLVARLSGQTPPPAAPPPIEAAKNP
jgi:hypothetical protein